MASSRVFVYQTSASPGAFACFWALLCALRSYYSVIFISAFASRPLKLSCEVMKVFRGFEFSPSFSLTEFQPCEVRVIAEEML